MPNVARKDYSLVDITEEDFTSLMDEEGACREDIKLPDVPDNFGGSRALLLCILHPAHTSLNTLS